LQYFIKKYLTTRITMDMVNEADIIITAHGEPFNRKGWEYIVNKLDGKIPLEIKSIKEGTIVPFKNVLATIVNTDPKCGWVTSYFETSILRAAWYGTTVATLSKQCKNIIQAAMEKSSDRLEGLEFKLHDFGARGVNTFEGSQIGGAAHLVNFMGTDTMSALITVMKYYNTTEMPGFSVPAAEHSTISPWGRGVGEIAAYRNMLTQYGGTYPIIAVVSDTWNIFEAASDIWGEVLRQEVMDSGSMVVIRPDSGDPKVVVNQLLNRLGEKFGYEYNKKGYKILNNVRILQGDGINVNSIPEIIDYQLNDFWSMDNLVLGMGGGLLQMVNRDTLKFAMKCSAINIDGEWEDVYKDPITDPGKTSKKGRLELIKFDGQYATVREPEPYVPGERLLNTVFLNGELTSEITFEEVRELASQ